MSTLQAMRQALHFSVSQLKSFTICPEQYRLQYVEGSPPQFVPIPLAFGKAFHAALGAWYVRVKGTAAAPVLEEVLAVFEEQWKVAANGPVPLQQVDEDDEPGAIVDKGVAMLRAFHADALTRPLPDVQAIELPFSVELHDPETGEVLEERLTGAFDLVVREEGRRIIVEHKTSARKYGADQLRFDPQLTAYQLAARELGLGEVGLRYQVVTKTKNPAVQLEDVRRDDADEQDFLRATVGVLRAIDAGAFWPVRGWQCRGCPHAAACAAKSRRS